jgi:hypothetical protein
VIRLLHDALSALIVAATGAVLELLALLPAVRADERLVTELVPANDLDREIVRALVAWRDETQR